MNQKREIFSVWDAPMVRACIQGDMGRVEAWGEDSALAEIGDFCFLAGEPVPELIGRADAPILVPGSSDWSRMIENTLGGRAVPFTRHAVRSKPEGFRCDKLIHLTSSMPQGFSIHIIEREICFTLLEREWSRDLCGCFADEADFLKRGLGFVVKQGSQLVAGASSYAACAGAIEIEIDTRPDFRGQGLAAACGAKLILECLDRGIYPGWDAHDRRSLSLAEKLGYQLEHPYTAYWVEENGKK